MKWMTIFICAILVAGAVHSENYASLNEKGNKAFQKGDIKTALDLYHQAEIERPETPEIYYNQANALIANGSYEEAIEKYQKALNTNDVSLQARIQYNNGNGYMKKQEYQKAIESYKGALELNPSDIDAKYNLELARTLLKEQLKKQPQDKNQKQQQQQQKQEQQDKKDKKDQKDQQDQKDKKDQQQQNQGENQDQKQQQKQEQAQKQPKPDEMSKEDAMRILRAMSDADKSTQKNMKRFKGTGNYRGKDW